MVKVDFVVKNCSQLITLYGGVKRGIEMRELGIIENGIVGSYRGRITFVGDEKLYRENVEEEKNIEVIDAEGRICMPGFVDPHTHIPFYGTRRDEFKLKLEGVSYMELQKRGMGIKSTVRATREAELKEILEVSQKRADEMLFWGTTSFEAKSGYGLDFETEKKQLEVLRVLNQIHPSDIVSTYLGAHDIPPDMGKEEYIELMEKEYIKKIAEEGLSKYFDAFLEEGIYEREDIERLFKVARENGFELKLHADEFTNKEGAELAVKWGARSAEHLLKVSDRGIDALSKSDTSAVILPGVYFFLREKESAPVRKMIDRGVIVALGSDYNPGSSMIGSMLFILRLGVFISEFTIEEAITAGTINSSYAIGLEKEVGSLEPGKKMDLVIFNEENYIDLFYKPSTYPIHMVIKEGEVVVKEGRLVYQGE